MFRRSKRQLLTELKCRYMMVESTYTVLNMLRGKYAGRTCSLIVQVVIVAGFQEACSGSMLKKQVLRVLAQGTCSGIRRLGSRDYKGASAHCTGCQELRKQVLRERVGVQVGALEYA
jgi:hypothetical protein